MRRRLADRRGPASRGGRRAGTKANGRSTGAYVFHGTVTVARPPAQKFSGAALLCAVTVLPPQSPVKDVPLYTV